MSTKSLELWSWQRFGERISDHLVCFTVHEGDNVTIDKITEMMMFDGNMLCSCIHFLTDCELHTAFLVVLVDQRWLPCMISN